MPRFSVSVTVNETRLRSSVVLVLLFLVFLIDQNASRHCIGFLVSSVYWGPRTRVVCLQFLTTFKTCVLVLSRRRNSMKLCG